MADNKYDPLKMFFNEDFVLMDGFVVHQPTIQEIIDYGESDFYNVINMLCANPTSLRLELWNNGLDWNDLEDFDIFKLFATLIPQEYTEILFKDIDLRQFREVIIGEESVLVYLPNPNIKIDEIIHKKLVDYLRALFNIHPKIEKARNKATKEDMIWEDRMNLKIASRENENKIWKQSILFPMISAALAHPGFKYKKNELREIGIFEFMDSIQRLQLYDETNSFRTGMYMGMMDLNKIDLKKELNWMRDIYEK